MSAGEGGPVGNGDQAADPGEGRLVAYLEELREDPPPTDAALTRQVTRRARWQRTLRGPLQLVGHLGGAFLDGIALLFGGSGRANRDRTGR